MSIPPIRRGGWRSHRDRRCLSVPHTLGVLVHLCTRSRKATTMMVFARRKDRSRRSTFMVKALLLFSRASDSPPSCKCRRMLGSQTLGRGESRPERWIPVSHSSLLEPVDCLRFGDSHQSVCLHLSVVPERNCFGPVVNRSGDRILLASSTVASSLRMYNGCNDHHHYVPLP